MWQLANCLDLTPAGRIWQLDTPKQGLCPQSVVGPVRCLEGRGASDVAPIAGYLSCQEAWLGGSER
jgi:hypothetical protein